MFHSKKTLGIILSLCLLVSGFSLLLAQSAFAKTAVMIIANKGFQDDEFQQPKQVLEDAGIKVTVASTSLDEAVGMNGAKVKPDILIKDIDINAFDTILFIGGNGAVEYLDDPVAQKISQDAVSANKIVGAICTAPLCLARAGVLKDKKATVYPVESNQKELAACGVTYTAADVEIDGNIITASGPSAAKKFGEEILKAIK